MKLLWMRRLLSLWEDGFRRYQPGIRIQYEMHGTSSAIPSLYAGVGDLAILGEEIDPAAVNAFEKVKGYPPTGIEIMTGSLDVRNFDFAQMFFVHRDNPVSRLSLAQLDAIFGCEHRRGTANMRTWGALGLTGEWADKPIHPYGWSYDNDFWNLFLQDAIFAGSHRWNVDLKEFAHIYNPDGTIYDAGQQILEALARDRYGIALSNRRYASPEMPVKALALSSDKDGPYYEATRQTLIERTYPLTRIIPAVVNRPPDGSIDPKTREFLRFILSREGQDAIVQDGRYLPLAPAAAASELAKLEIRGAQPARAVPPEAPSPAAAGTIRIWGDDTMSAVVRNWAEGYQRIHPEVKIEAHLMGTATGMPGLYLNQADVALLGRDPDTTDSDGFLHNRQYRPVQLRLTNATLDAADKSHALAVFVRHDNPLDRLTLAQLDAVFGTEHRRSPRNLRTWGDLGLTGAWRDRPVHLYLFDVQTHTGLFFLHAVLGDSRKLNWENLTEFEDLPASRGIGGSCDQRIIDALGKDRFGLAVCGLHYATPAVRTIALSAQPNGPYVLPTRDSIAAGRYPLGRTTYAFADRQPGKPMDPKVEAFLRYLLSREGQADLAREGNYIPLDEDSLGIERRRLE